ncbi:MAG: hypothetical protein ACRCU5_13850 [Rhizobiaceae bacterium]
MATLLLSLGSAITSGASAVGSAITGAGAASSGFSLSSLLQGTMTVLGVVSEISAGKADAAQAELAAGDAESEKQIETLQGIDRRASIKRAMMDAVGAQDTAYAGSGVDLSFGTAAQARKDAFREADYALTSDVSTEDVRKSRLTERAANYRSQAKRAKSMGMFRGFSAGLKGLADMKDRY